MCTRKTGRFLFPQYRMNILSGVQTGAFVEVLCVSDVPALSESCKSCETKPKLVAVEQLAFPTRAVKKVKTHRLEVTCF